VSSPLKMLTISALGQEGPWQGTARLER